jgi:glycerol-3-phosphate dehydrogenase
MERNLSRLSNDHFDLVIIGGGITGACLAADATLRGMSVALVEQGDFGAATSASSSKLLHGGLRYLQQGAINKVRESALERVFFQMLAPHLTHYVPFLVPTYRSLGKSMMVMKTAMTIYELLCTGQNRHITDPDKRVPGSRSIGREELSKFLPEFDTAGMNGGIIFSESHMHSSERMTLAFLDTADRNGASIANYLRADGFVVENNRITGVQVRDLTGDNPFEIQASLVINAAGPWIPLINRRLGRNGRNHIVTGFSKGAHIVTRALTRDVAVALTTKRQSQALLTRGGRHVFIIPWRGYSLIGTTYKSYAGELDEVGPDEDDIQDLINDINSAAGSPVLQRSDVMHSYAGIYPLIEDTINPKVYQGTGKYQVLDHAVTDGVEGLVSVFGAKYTTARLLAEKALNQVIKKSGKSFDECKTRTMPLVAGNITGLAHYIEEKQNRYTNVLPGDTIRHLVINYGTAIDDIVALVKDNPDLGRFLAEGHANIAAEVIHAASNEMAYHLTDVLMRRTGLGTLGNPGRKCLLDCAELMGNHLGWDTNRRKMEVEKAEQAFVFHVTHH